MKARPLLRWVGGKTSSLTSILKRAPKTYGCYLEPFVGGGALFFALQPKRAILSDSNERLVRTYRAVRDSPQILAEQLRWLQTRFRERGELFYYEQRARDVDKLLDVDVASWMIFLNKAGFNGLYRVNKAGKVNVPVGVSANPEKPVVILDEENLRACSLALQGVQVEHWDFRAAGVAAEPGDFVYCDPPYIPVDDTSFTKYTSAGFGPKDQEALRDMTRSLKKRGVHVLISNSGSAQAQQLYQEAGFTIEEMAVRRSINSAAGGRGQVKELLIS